MEKLKKELLNATIETLENMAFMEVRTGRFYWASITVEQPESGLITISFPEQLARRLTESFLGLPRAEQKDQDLADCMGELVNTIAGLPDKGFGRPQLPPDTVQDYYEIDGETFHIFISGGEGLKVLSDNVSDSGAKMGDAWGSDDVETEEDAWGA